MSAEDSPEDRRRRWDEEISPDIDAIAFALIGSLLDQRFGTWNGQSDALLRSLTTHSVRLVMDLHEVDASVRERIVLDLHRAAVVAGVAAQIAAHNIRVAARAGCWTLEDARQRLHTPYDLPDLEDEELLTR